MGWFKHRTRRQVLHAAGGLIALLAPRSTSAQDVHQCDVEWVNGLLAVGGPECDLPGVPPHLAGSVIPNGGFVTERATNDEFAASGTSTTGMSTTGYTTSGGPLTPRERRLRRREHHQQKFDNNHAHRQVKHDRHRVHRQRKRESRWICDDFTTRKAAQNWLAQHPEDARWLDPDGDGIACEHMLVTCDEFSSQKDAIEWIAQHPGDRPELDPDNDGVACEHLDTVRCTNFGRRSDVVAWLTQHGWTVATNPFNLHKNADGMLCPSLPVACEDFSSQVAAQGWWNEYGKKGDKLDPNANGVACEHLP